MNFFNTGISVVVVSTLAILVGVFTGYSSISMGGITILATFIGAWTGAWVIVRRQELKNIYPRELLSGVLNKFLGYPTYDKAKDEFNKYSLVEKKAVIVALKNLGVPIVINIANDTYDIENIKFDEKPVTKEAITKMIDFVNKGLCDDLFFKEIGSNFFNASPKIIFARELAIKFLDALSTQPNTTTINDIMRVASINFNQFQVIQVFWSTVDVFNDDNTLSGTKIKNAKANVKNGVFDHLFYWDFRAFSNLSSQKNLADAVLQQYQPVTKQNLDG
ncbi:TPA: hypothetical protein ACPZHQ_002259 [Yersinia enterocolitica]